MLAGAKSMALSFGVNKTLQEDANKLRLDAFEALDSGADSKSLAQAAW